METVIECNQVRTWKANDGKDLPVYLIKLSTGKSGESFQTIPIGTPIEQLVITPNSNPAYADKIKWNKPNAGGGGFGGRGGNRGGNESFALSYAKDLAIAYVAKDKMVEPAKIVEWAEVFYNWMETKKK